MKIPLTLLLLTMTLSAEAPKFAYPETRKADQIDDYHGTKVPDPYRWLEDDNSAETKAWVEAQNKVTFGFLEQIPVRNKIRARLKELINHERFGIPYRRGDRYFYTRNSGLQDQSVLYVTEGLAGEPRVLLDPNTLSPDGTVSLAGYAISEDGALMAYGLARSGSDWHEWHVCDVKTGQDRDDVLQWVKFSGASWDKDGSGFYYSRFDAPKPGAQLTALNEYQKLCFHRLGTPQSEDPIVYERRDHKDWGFGGSVTDDGDYLVITATQGTDTRNRVYYRDLTKPTAKVIPLLEDFDASYDFIDNDGPIFYFKTDLEAPRSRVIAIDVTKPARDNWRELIPQAADALGGVNRVNGQFYCTYLHDAHSVVKIFARGEDRGAASRAKFLRDLPLPGLVSVGGFGGRNTDTETFYAVSGFTSPSVIYRLDTATGESAVFREPQVPFHPTDYETEQVFFNSKDGTRVPMFLVHKRGLKLDGSNPTLLYGYGGFDIALTPGFAESRIAWLERDGVYVEANLRGGGEYGKEWHLAGTKDRKQNVFDDFIGAAEWLIAKGYTSAPKLAIEGGSNGGLLVGACMTQRPELFGAAIPHVGVMDMLRFHKFTIGWAWTSDYGSSDNADEFKALFAYSPLHRLKPATRYPATLVCTADHDDRVVPAHSFKFAARLQECQPPDAPPVLIRIETKAGHGSGVALTKKIEENADKLAFLARILGIEGGKE